jgi:anti-anti-sigma regulatory factor
MKYELNHNGNYEEELNKKIREMLEDLPIKDIILDFSCINSIDSMGINALIQVII